MPDDYEVTVEIGTNQIGAKLANDPEFIKALTPTIRKIMLQIVRQNPDLFGNKNRGNA